MMPLENLKHLKFFCDVAANKSLSKAAKMNFVSKFAISKSIVKLEIIFGMQLINSHSDLKLELTLAGKILFSKAHEIFHCANKIINSVGYDENLG